MVKACADKDRNEILARSTKLGFLTGAPLSYLSIIPSMEPTYQRGT
jgi:hypothetical protein